MKFITLILCLFLIAFCCLPLSAALADDPPDNPGDENGTTTVDIGPPWEGGPDTIMDVVQNVTNWVLGIAGALAVLFIIISGIRYITSAGNQQLHEAAKKNLTSAIIGLVIVLIAFIIVNVISRVLTTG